MTFFLFVFGVLINVAVVLSPFLLPAIAQRAPRYRIIAGVT
jgi:hypothetical protein